MSPRIPCAALTFAETDEEVDRKKLEQLAESGDAAAQCGLGNIYENGWGVPANYESAAAWYRKAALQGHANAQFNLGLLYLTGEGSSQTQRKQLAGS